MRVISGTRDHINGALVSSRGKLGLSRKQKLHVSIAYCFSAVFTVEYDRILMFMEPVSNKAIEGHVIRTEQVSDEGSCRLQCYLEPNCVSINVGPFDERTQICELNDETDESLSHLALVERQRYTYHAVEV